MRLPRKGILIRLLIYVPLLGFFGWQAIDRYLGQKAARDADAQQRQKVEQMLEKQSRTVTLPDGSVQKVPVLTPEQAEELWGIEAAPTATKRDTPAGDTASAPAEATTNEPNVAEPAGSTAAPEG